MHHHKYRLIFPFLLPAIVIYGLFVVWPYAQAIYISLTSWRGVSGNKPFVGLDNYERLLGDGRFLEALTRNGQLLVVLPLVTVVIALTYAALFTQGNQQIRGAGFYRIVFFFPQIISAVIVGILWSYVYTPNIGLLNGVLRATGLEGVTRSWLTDPATVLWSIVAVAVWSSVGFYMVIFLAAMRSLGVAAWGIPADLARVSEAHRLAEEALARVPRLDILVNNAGTSIRGHFWEVSDSDWEEQVNVNYRAPFVLAQHVARHMLHQDIRGRIVNIGTIGARAAHKDAAVYDSAKGAVEVMTRNMAYELAPHGISVNCVVPGAISERPGAPERPDAWDGARRNIPYGRVGRAEDIAAAVRFCCLPESGFTTGQCLLVDGGHSIYLHE
jgi:NAD(P)-dependent dehydrogenase (short-subunit alcohol dehydrogenase family)